jgi:ribose transport system substrate-binding protein
MKKTTMFMYTGLMILLVISIVVAFYYSTLIKGYNQQLKVKEEKELPAYHFVLIGEEMDHDYWRLVGEGAKAAEENNDVYVEYKGPKRSNPEEQAKLLDVAIKSKVDGIIVQALTEEFIPLINKATESGIPVITIDTDAPSSKRSTYIGTDNYKAGQLAGQTLVEDTNGQAVVGIITGSFRNAHHELRVEGFMDAIEGEEGIEVVSIEESTITRVVAEEKAHKMLLEYPQITALYGTSALDGIGMVQASESLQISDEELYMIAFDTLPENIELLEDGKVDALVGQKPYEMGYRSVELMLSILAKEQVDDVYYTDTTIVRNEDLKRISDRK